MSDTEIEVRQGQDDWWWVECDCGYYTGPFDGQSDANIDAREHDCPENVDSPNA